MKCYYIIISIAILLVSACKKKEEIKPQTTSTSNNNTWVEVTNGFAQNVIPYGIASLNNKLFAITAYGGVYVSTDNGNSWTHTPSANLPQDNSGGGSFYSSFSSAGNRLFVSLGSGTTFQSFDESVSWNAVNYLNFYTQDFNHETVGIDNNYYCIKGLDNGSFNGSFYKSNNNGGSWANSGNGLPSSGINTYLLTGNLYSASANPAKIFCSTDNCDTWNFLSDVPNVQVVTHMSKTNTQYLLSTVNGLFSTQDFLNYSMITNGISSGAWLTSMVNDGNKVIVSTFMDNYYSSDGGNSWAKITDIPQVATNFQIVAFVNGYAFAKGIGKLYRKQY